MHSIFYASRVVLKSKTQTSSVIFLQLAIFLPSGVGAFLLTEHLKELQLFISPPSSRGAIISRVKTKRKKKSNYKLIKNFAATFLLAFKVFCLFLGVKVSHEEHISLKTGDRLCALTPHSVVDVNQGKWRRRSRSRTRRKRNLCGRIHVEFLFK